MSGNKRQKELARAKYERQQARRSTSAERSRRRQRIVAAIVVAVLVLAGITWFAVSRSGGSSAPVAQASTPAPQPSVAASATPSGTSAANAVADCTAPTALRTDDLTWDKAPADSTKATTLTLTTNCGPIEIALDAKAPKTISSEAFLASKGFYDGTKCHRLTTEGIFVLQCGDPKGDGTGGPGYSIPDENLPAKDGVNYPAGTVAMANAGPGTGGSQFFIVYQDTTLPPNYTVWGKVTKGLPIVEAVAAAGVEGGATDGAPHQPVVISSAKAS